MTIEKHEYKEGDMVLWQPASPKGTPERLCRVTSGYFGYYNRLQYLNLKAVATKKLHCGVCADRLRPAPAGQDEA